MTITTLFLTAVTAARPGASVVRPANSSSLATACASSFQHAFIGNSAVLWWPDVRLTSARRPAGQVNRDTVLIQPTEAHEIALNPRFAWEKPVRDLVDATAVIVDKREENRLESLLN